MQLPLQAILHFGHELHYGLQLLSRDGSCNPQRRNLICFACCQEPSASARIPARLAACTQHKLMKINDLWRRRELSFGASLKTRKSLNY
jgi:hypothetical protein